MTDVQLALLGLLKEIDQICKKYEIEYYLAGGSQIGAIRHGGFLPWDDDADIHMSRDNADRFLEAVKKENLPDRVVYTGDENGRYMNAHWRYENTATTLLLRGLVGSPCPQGQFVDIFVNYPLPKDEKKRQRCLDDFELYVELKANNATIKSLRSEEYLKRYYRALRIEKIVGHNRFLKYLEKRMFCFPEEKADEWFIRSPLPPQRATPKAWWGKPRYVPFEDTWLPIAEMAEVLLNQQYGPNWFEIPDYVDRESHIFVTDLNTPYDFYVSEYKKYVDTAEFYQFEVDKKRKWFELLYKKNEVNPQIHRLQGEKISLELQEIIKRQQIDLKKLVEEERFDELEMIFENYYNFVNSENVRYWGLYIDLPDELLYAALYHCCVNATYGMARKILGKRRTIISRKLTEDLQNLCDICDATDELLTALYGNRDLAKAKALCDVWLEKNPKLLYFMRADIYVGLELDEGKAGRREDLYHKCKEYLKIYPQDGELLKYLGDLYEQNGEENKAKECYRQALYKTRNGFCLKELKKILDIA